MGGAVIQSSPEIRFGTHDIGDDDPVDGLVLLECLTYHKSLLRSAGNEPVGSGGGGGGRVTFHFFDGPQPVTTEEVYDPILPDTGTNITAHACIEAVNTTELHRIDANGDRTPEICLPNGRRATGQVVRPASDAFVNDEGDIVPAYTEEPLPGVALTLLTDAEGGMICHGRDDPSALANPDSYGTGSGNPEIAGFSTWGVPVRLGPGDKIEAPPPESDPTYEGEPPQADIEIGEQANTETGGPCACRADDPCTPASTVAAIDPPTGDMIDSYGGNGFNPHNGIQLTSNSVLPAPWNGIQVASIGGSVGREFIGWADGALNLGLLPSTRNLKKQLSEAEGGPLDSPPVETGPWESGGGCLQIRKLTFIENWTYERATLVRRWHRTKDVFDKDGYKAAMAAYEANQGNPEVEAIEAEIAKLEALAETILAGVKGVALADLLMPMLEGGIGRGSRIGPGKVTAKGAKEIQKEAGAGARAIAPKEGAAAGGKGKSDEAETVANAQEAWAKAQALRQYLEENYAYDAPDKNDFMHWGAWKNPEEQLSIYWTPMSLSRKVQRQERKDCDKSWMQKGPGQVVDYMGQEAEWKEALEDRKEWEKGW